MFGLLAACLGVAVVVAVVALAAKGLFVASEIGLVGLEAAWLAFIVEVRAVAKVRFAVKFRSVVEL